MQWQHWQRAFLPITTAVLCVHVCCAVRGWARWQMAGMACTQLPLFVQQQGTVAAGMASLQVPAHITRTRRGAAGVYDGTVLAELH